MRRWNLLIPEETDRRVRGYLARTGGKKGDLSKFVDHAVRQALFWDTVENIQERNKDLSPEEAQVLADEALDSWEAYQETGLHVTGREAREWLNRWGTGNETEIPKCHE